MKIYNELGYEVHIHTEPDPPKMIWDGKKFIPNPEYMRRRNS